MPGKYLLRRSAGARCTAALLLFLALTGPALADSTVTALTAASALTGAELVYCVQSAADRKCTITQVQTFVLATPTITGHPTIEGVTSTGATGTGNLVFATAPTVSSLTVSSAFTATGLVTNADLANPATTVNGQTCTLGSTCTVAAAAGTLTGTTLASNVVSTSITSTGTMTSGTLSTGYVIGGVTMTLGSDATGDIYYRNSSGVLTRLAVCTGTNVLGASGGLPACVAQSGGGGLTVGTTTVSGGSAGNLLYTDATNLQATGGITFAGTGQLAIATGTITTNLAALSITQTWNAAGTTFDAPLFMNITKTASASGSLMLDIQLGGSTVVKIDRFGEFYGLQGIQAPDIALDDSANLLGLASSTRIGWTAGGATATPDTTQCRSSAGVVQIGASASCASSGSLLLANITPSGFIKNTGITADTGLTDVTVCEATTTGGGGVVNQFYSGTGTAGICVGNVSSIRFKHDWTDISDGLSVMRALDPGTYRYNEGIMDGGAQLRVGFTAERYATVLPQFTRYDSEHRPDGLDMLAALPYAVRAIQQLDAELAALRARLAALERR